jgi:hypothetical protein
MSTQCFPVYTYRVNGMFLRPEVNQSVYPFPLFLNVREKFQKNYLFQIYTNNDLGFFKATL